VNMRRTEDQHNSPEQVAEYVRQALAVAQECELSDDDRRLLLPTILTQLASKQVFYEQVAPIGGLTLPRPQG
jgi:hypothetical protein